MTQLNRITALFCALAAVFSCGQQSLAPAISLDRTEVNLPYSGGAERVRVKCSGSWEFSSDVPWLSVRREGSDVLLLEAVCNEAEPGSAAMGRGTTVQLSSGESSVYLKVSQDAEPAVVAFLGMTGPVGIEAKGQRLDVTVEYNSSYTVVLPDDAPWIRRIDSKALSSEIVSFNIDANISEMRTARIVFKSFSGDRVLEVKQDAFILPKVISTPTELAALLANVNKLKKGDLYTLGADIDLKGVSLPKMAPTDTLRADFDGRGYRIRNWNTDSPLFLNSASHISNVIFDWSCNLQWSGALTEERCFTFLVGDNFGVVSGCENYGSISVKNTGAQKIFLAGLVGRQAALPLGTVEDCKNHGSIYLEASASQSCSSIGGVVSRAGHAKRSTTVLVKNCINDGNIEFKYTGAAKTMAKFGIGGVLGQTPSVAADATKGVETPNHGIVEGCTNSGNIKWTYTEGGSGAYPCMGGIAGIIEGEIRNCENSGNLSFVSNATVAVTNSNFGGVAGYVTYNADNCRNYGHITVTGAYAGGTRYAQSGGNCEYTCMGGVFGGAGPYLWSDDPSSCKISVTNCHNYADLALTPSMASSGGPVFSIGGVVGFASAKLLKCSNEGSLSLTTNAKTIMLGGIAGATTATVEDCSNAKNVSFDGKTTSAAACEILFMGGAVGRVMQTKCVISNVVNTGDILLSQGIHSPDNWSYAGGILGGYSGVYSHIVRDCSFSGTVTNNSTLCCCFGGIAGAMNGTVDHCEVKDVRIENNSSLVEADRPYDIGLVCGYANATLSNITASGSVSSKSESTSMSAFVGAVDKCTLVWENNVVTDCAISNGSPVTGQVIGRHRTAAAAGNSYYVRWKGGSVSVSPSGLPMVGLLNGMDFSVQ